MSLADVLPMLSFFQTRSVQQSTTFRGPIEIGDTIKINVYGYVKVGSSIYLQYARSKIKSLSLKCHICAECKNHSCLGIEENYIFK